MTVPETAVDEDDGLVFREDEVGLAGERAVERAVHRETIAETVEDRAQGEFGFRVAPANAGHDLGALFRSEDVHTGTERGMWNSQSGNVIGGSGIAEYHGRVVFEDMQLWIDPVKRSGPEAMAVDEWLLETVEAPVLRVYGWLGEWGTVGYFGKLADARISFPEVEWVRRWTGGGTVDHRADWTYSVIVPDGEPLVSLRGAESYLTIHAVLADVLQREGIDARLSTGAEATGAAACFENPVSHDLVGAGNRKIAGAGQRRTKRGLLHQGSVAAACEPDASRHRAERLAAAMAARWVNRDFLPPAEVIALKIRGRYALEAWTGRR